MNRGRDVAEPSRAEHELARSRGDALGPHHVSSCRSHSVEPDPDATPRPLRITKRPNSMVLGQPGEGSPVNEPSYTWQPAQSRVISPQHVPLRRSSAVKIDGETWKDLLSVYSGENEDNQVHSRLPSPSLLKGKRSTSQARLDVRKQRQPPLVSPTTPASQPSVKGRNLFSSLKKLSTGIKEPVKGSIRSVKGSRAFEDEAPLPGLDQNDFRGEHKGGRAVSVGTYHAASSSLAGPKTEPLRSVTAPGGALPAQRSQSTTAAFGSQRNGTVKHIPAKRDGSKSTRIGELFQDLEKLARKKSRAMFYKSEAEFKLLRRSSAGRTSHEGQGFVSSSYDGEANQARSRTVSSTSTVVTMRRSSDSHGTRISSIQEDVPITTDPGLWKSSHSAAAQPRILVAPQEAPVLGARIRIVPETDAVEANAEGSLWVAVNVSADVGLNDTDGGVSQTAVQPLDVVICIQSSDSTPVQTVASCKGMVVMIASYLDSVIDRVAIVESRVGDTGASGHWVLSTLREVDVAHIVGLTTIIGGTYDTMTQVPGSIRSAVQFCTDLLLFSTARHGPEFEAFPGSIQDTARSGLGHIFMISSETVSCSEAAPDGIQVHYINPTPLPWEWQPRLGHGWQLHLPPPLRMESRTQTEPDGSSGWLVKLFHSARLGLLPGRLKDVTMAIDAGPNCTIQRVLGRTGWEYLNPGQTVRLLVKVQHSSRPSPRTPAADVPDVSEFVVSSQEALDELDTLLGEAVQELIHVELRYRHTLLPPGTVLSLRETGTVKKHATDLTWSPVSARKSLDDPYSAVGFQIRLIEFVASSQHPKQALAVLESIYGDAGGARAGAYRPPLLKCMLEELHHRASTLDRPQPHDALRLSNDEEDLMASPPQSDLGRYHGLDKISETGISDLVATSPQARPLSYPGLNQAPISGANTITPRSTSTEEGGPMDKARQIWAHLRRASKGYPHDRSSPSSSISSPILISPPPLPHRHTQPASIPPVPSISQQAPSSQEMRASSSSSSVDSIVTATINHVPRPGCANHDDVVVDDANADHEAFVSMAALISDMARQAIRNKRSIGADTLKSFALGGYQDVGLIAPWL